MCDFVDIESNDFTVANALKMKSLDMVSEISNKDDTEILRRLARHSKPLVSSSLESRRVCSTLCDILFAYVNIRSHFTMFVSHTHTHIGTLTIVESQTVIQMWRVDGIFGIYLPRCLGSIVSSLLGTH